MPHLPIVEMQRKHRAFCERACASYGRIAGYCFTSLMDDKCSWDLEEVMRRERLFQKYMTGKPSKEARRLYRKALSEGANA